MDNYLNNIVYGTLCEEQLNIITQENKNKIPEYETLRQKCIILIDKYIVKNKDFNMTELTINDLTLMQEYNKLIYKPIDYSIIWKYNDSYKSIPVTNYDHFVYEETDFVNFKLLIKYINDKYKLKIDYKNTINPVYTYNIFLFDLKQHYNRPRAFQTSYYTKIPIKHFNTIAGQTPSLPHGHSFQGMYFGCLLYQQVYKVLDDTDMNLLIDICVGLGQRRIVCGVHYPSDVAASLIIFQTLVKHLKIENMKKYITLVKNKIKDYLY